MKSHTPMQEENIKETFMITVYFLITMFLKEKHTFQVKELMTVKTIDA